MKFTKVMSFGESYVCYEKKTNLFGQEVKVQL